jgi:hypothetical protein
VSQRGHEPDLRLEVLDESGRLLVHHRPHTPCHKAAIQCRGLLVSSFGCFCRSLGLGCCQSFALLSLLQTPHQGMVQLLAL